MSSPYWLCKTLKGGQWIAPNQRWMRLWLTQVSESREPHLCLQAVQKEVLLHSAPGLFCISSLVFPGIYSALVSPGPQRGHTSVASQSPTEGLQDFCSGLAFLPKWAHPEPGNNPPSLLIWRPGSPGQLYWALGCRGAWTLDSRTRASLWTKVTPAPQNHVWGTFFHCSVSNLEEPLWALVQDTGCQRSWDCFQRCRWWFAYFLSGDDYRIRHCRSWGREGCE